MIYVLMIILGCGISFALIIIMIGWIQQLIKQYIKIWQILLWMSMIISLSVCFDRQIHWFYPINAVWIGVLIEVIICVVCVVLRNKDKIFNIKNNRIMTY